MTTKSHSSRRSYVCDQCYRCKVQCSKEQPSCKRCQKADRPCTYSLGLWKGRSRDLQRGSQDKEKSIEPTTKTGSKDPNQQGTRIGHAATVPADFEITDTQRSFNNFRLQDEHAITVRRAETSQSSANPDRRAESNLFPTIRAKSLFPGHHYMVSPKLESWS